MSITIVSSLLNGFDYCDLTRIFLFDINYLLAHSEVILDTKYSIQHYSFTCTQSDGSKRCYVIPKIKILAHS